MSNPFSAAIKVRQVIVGVGNVRHMNSPTSIGLSTMNLLHRKLKLEWEYKPVIGCKIATKGSRLFVQPQHFNPLPTAKALSAILKHHKVETTDLTVIYDDNDVPSGKYLVYFDQDEDVENERLVNIEGVIGSSFRKFAVGTKIPEGEGFADDLVDRFRGHGKLRKGQSTLRLKELEPRMPFLPLQKQMITDFFQNNEKQLIEQITDPHFVGDNLNGEPILRGETENQKVQGETIRTKYTLVYDQYNEEGEGVGDGQLVPIENRPQQLLEGEEHEGSIEEGEVEEHIDEKSLLHERLHATTARVFNKHALEENNAYFETLKKKVNEGTITKEDLNRKLNKPVDFDPFVKPVNRLDDDDEDPEDTLEEGEMEKNDDISDEELRKILEYNAPPFLQYQTWKLQIPEEALSKEELEQRKQYQRDLEEGEKLTKKYFGEYVKQKRESGDPKAQEQLLAMQQFVEKFGNFENLDANVAEDFEQSLNDLEEKFPDLFKSAYKPQQ